MNINTSFLEQKFITLTKDLEYINMEINKLTIIKIKTEGAIEIMQGLIEDSKKVEITEDKKD